MFRTFGNFKWLPAAVLLSAFSVGNAVADDLQTCIHESGEVAIEACNRAINSGRYQDVDLANAYLNRGAEWLDKHEYDKAISDSTQSIKIFPQGTIAYVNRAGAYEAKGNLKGALADASVAIEHDQENPAAYVRRAGLYEKLNDRDSAIRDLQRALKCKPKSGKFVDVEKHFKDARDELARLTKR